MKKAIVLAALASVLFLGLIVKASFASQGKISDGQDFGFGVDSQGNLYLGDSYRRIHVICDGEVQGEIPVLTGRAYSFFAEDDRLILAYATGGGDIYDLTDRHYAEESELKYEEVKGLAAHKKRIEANGSQYQIKRYLGFKPYEIIRDGEIVYRQTALDYGFNGLPFWACFGILVLGIVFVVLLAISDRQRESC